MSALSLPIYGVKGFSRFPSGDYLFLHRSKPRADGSYWDIPGGHLEASDRNIEAAFRRELLEETKLFGDIVADVDVQRFEHEGAWFERRYIIAEAAGSVVLSSEHDDYLLLPHPTDALDLVAMDPYIAQVIESRFTG